MATINGTARGDTLTGTAAADMIYGLAGNDTLSGGAGDDTIDGGTGADKMGGGEGGDLYIVDNVSDRVVETGTTGIDRVQTTLRSYVLATNVEDLTLMTAGSTGIGNDLANQIRATSGADSLDGAGGDDTLFGSAGADTMTGSDGDDMVVYASTSQMAGDLVHVSDGLDTLRLDAAQAWTITTAFADRILLNADGPGFVLTIGEEVVFEADANGDQDALRSDLRIAATGTLRHGIRIQTAQDASHAENGLDVDGTHLSGADTIVGATGADTISAGAGADRIEGRMGADILWGGAGNDTFVYAGAHEGWDFAEQRYRGDLLVDFDAGTGKTTVDRIAFDISGFGTLGKDLTITGAAGGNKVLNNAANELVIRTDAAVTDATVEQEIASLTAITHGVIWIGFNQDAGCAQVWYDSAPAMAGGQTLLANIASIQSLAAMSALNTGDFMFV